MGYVERAWYPFELYTAIQLRDEADIEIVLSAKQAQSFHDRINADGTDVDAIDSALAHIHAESASATVAANLDAIRALIRQTSGGFDTINNTVKQYTFGNGSQGLHQGGIKVAARVAHLVTRLASDSSSCTERTCSREAAGGE